jgi:predicted transcriptional regulator
MSQRNASVTDTLTTILASATGKGASDKDIMVRTHLSYNYFMRYLTVLFQNALIEYDESKNLIKTSEKGKRLLATCKEIQEFIH